MAPKKSFVFCLACFVLTITAYAQDLSGYWQGKFRTDQRLSGRSETFFMAMALNQQGRKIAGQFYTAPLAFPKSQTFIYEISGLIGKKEKIPASLTRGRILYARLPEEIAEYFLSFEEINYEKNDTVEILYGKWRANGLASLRSDGYAGVFSVSRPLRNDTLKTNIAADTNVVSHYMPVDTSIVLIPTQMIKRTNLEEGHIIVNTRKISLTIYDNSITDGDSVSIFLNGSLLLAHQLVSEKPVILEIELDKDRDKNEITLFAENLGSIPPNTALVVVNAGEKRYELFATADLEKNAVLIIEYKPNN